MTAIKTEWLDAVLLLLVAATVANIVIGLVTGEISIFRIIPSWIILMAICVSQRQMMNQKILTVLGGTVLCYLGQTLMYLTQANVSDLQTTEMAVSIGLIYVPLLAFFTILVATKVENLQAKREHLNALLGRLRTEANDLVNRLHKARQGGEEEEEADDRVVAEKKAILGFYQNAFRGVMKIRYKRDIATLVRTVLSEDVKIRHGVVFEVPEEKAGDYKVRAFWGLGDEKRGIREKLAMFRGCDLTRMVADNRRALFIDEIKRYPNLYEIHDNFIRELFPLECILPIKHLEKALFVVYIGKQEEDAPIKFTPHLVEPLFSTAGQAIGKLMSRDARPSFSLFAPE